MHQLDQERAEWKMAAAALADRPQPTTAAAIPNHRPGQPRGHPRRHFGRPCGVLLTLDAQYLDLGSNDLCWPGRACEARRHRDLLRAVRHVGITPPATAPPSCWAQSFWPVAASRGVKLPPTSPKDPTPPAVR